MVKKTKSKSKPDRKNQFSVIFAGLESQDETPVFAAYQLDSSGKPARKLGTYDDGVLNINLDKVDRVAFGPDVDDPESVPRDSLTVYRVADRLESWRDRGIILARPVWNQFHFHYTCVTGTVRKCRPWYWRVLDDTRLQTLTTLSQPARFRPVTAELNPHIAFPLSCLPVCDGVVEVYEKECCCYHVHIPDLLERLREILERIPIPLPDPIPDPPPGPWPVPLPDPLPDPVFTRSREARSAAGFTLKSQRDRARFIRRGRSTIDLNAVPPEELFQDYQALLSLPPDEARDYVLARPSLIAILCQCSVRKVGQTSIQPGGKFDFCYRTFHRHLNQPFCSRNYAFVVKQLINGVLTVVYNGLTANQYFAAGSPVDIRTHNPRARICAEPGDPPPNDGNPFVMLENIGGFGTFHFNFPTQNAVSGVAPLDSNDGSFTTSYAPDCPWGGALALRLWFSPELEPVVSYYRLQVIAVSDSGSPTGTPEVLNNSVTWDKLVDIPGDTIRAPENLGPVSVGGENNLFRVPYWSSPDHRYLSGQFHQNWITSSTEFPDGKYMLVMEVFDNAGNRIKPNGATGPGNAANFEFRRWVSDSSTDPVPFADLVNVFWVDNTPVDGDIADLRQNGVPNTAECQFMSGNASDSFAIGFRAYHVNGVEHNGNGDQNSFMWRYHITWQRGLNGPSGSLGFAPSETNNHTDVGETGLPVASGSEAFSTLLGPAPVKPKCTFSVHLRVYAKHYNGSSRIQSYDFTETASFALEIT